MRPHPCVRNRGEDEVVELKIKNKLEQDSKSSESKIAPKLNFLK